MKLKKAWDFFCYYSLREFCGKAWEKYIVDRRRYCGGTAVLPQICEKPAQPLPKGWGPVEGPGPSVCFLVHFFYPEKSGGTERFVFNLAKTKLERGGRARVVTLSVGPVSRYPNRAGDILWRDYEYEGISVTEYRYRKTPCGVYYKRMEEEPAMEEFARMILERERFDVVHCAFPQPFAGFLKVCVERKLPYLVTNTGFGAFCHYTTLIDRTGALCPGSRQGDRCREVCPTYGIADYKQRFLVSERVLRNAAAVTAPSRYVSSRLGEEYPGLSVLTIPHGIGTGFVPDGREWKGNRFVFVGTFTRLKGIHVLLEAFKGMVGDYTLDLYGSGDPDYEKELKKAAAGDSRIAFCGFVAPEQVPQIYREHDVAVVPSVCPETYCFVLREALNCGCAVVASDIGAMPEAVRPGENGYICPPGDVSALRDAMERAAVLNAEEYDSVRFPDVAWESEAYENIYRNILDEMI